MTMLTQAREYLVAPRDPADDDSVATGAFALASVMTLVMLLLRTPSQATILLTALVILGLLARQHTTQTRWYWVVLFAVFLTSPLARPWLELDNHHFLLVYWMAALAVTRFASRPDYSLAIVARLLIGLAFAFAVTWKIMAPEFLDGSFFEFTFGTDNRLHDVATSVGLAEEGAAQDNRRTINSWRTASSEPSAGTLEIHDRIASISAPLAWLTVIFEGAVAITFLAPLPERWRWLRDATLIGFIIATYPLAPVLGFGWLLICMGAMQSQLRNHVRIFVYALTFAGLVLLEERGEILAWLGTIFS
jgi:hypothetical protein